MARDLFVVALAVFCGLSSSGVELEFGPETPLEEIRSAVRAERARSDEPIEVVLRDGVYRVEHPLELVAEDSGTEAASVIWRAEHPGRAVLSAATELAWRDGEDGLKIAEIPGTEPIPGFLNGAIMRGFENLIETPCFLVQDGERLPLSRYPNEGYLKIGDYVGGLVHTNFLGGYFISHKEAAFKTGEPTERMVRWAAERDLWAYGFWHAEWADAYLRVTNVNVAANTIKLCEQYPYRFRERRRYSIRNAVSEIDEPGEWALDRATRRVTLKPREGNPAVLVLHETILRGNGLHDVDFRGITFECTRKDALAFVGCTRVNVRGCTVRQTGGWGVRFEKSRWCRVEGCEMFELGEGGITLEGGDLQTLEPGENVADNNHIRHYGLTIANYRPGVSLNGVGNRATHNLIHHSEHQGLNFDGNDHYLGYNVLHDMCMHNDDAGAIYCCQRDWTKRGTVIEHNLVYFTGQKPVPTNCQAIYLDDDSSGTRVRGNILVRASVGVSMGGGHNTLVQSNVIVRMIDTPIAFSSRGPGSFADNGKPTGIRAGYNAGNFRRLDRMRSSIERYPEKWGRYPHLLDVYTVRPPRGDTTEPGYWAHHQLWSEIVGNLYVCSAAFNSRYYDKMSAYNICTNNEVTAEDPGFSDYAKLDFSAKKGGAYEPLISYCDFPKMGLYESPWRAGPVVKYGAGVTPAPLKLVRDFVPASVRVDVHVAKLPEGVGQVATDCENCEVAQWSRWRRVTTQSNFGEAKNEWTEYSFSFTPTVDGAAMFVLMGSLGKKTAYDDFKVEGLELLSPGFETDEGWRRPKNVSKIAKSDVSEPYGIVGATDGVSPAEGEKMALANQELPLTRSVRFRKGQKVTVTFKARAL